MVTSVRTLGSVASAKDNAVRLRPPVRQNDSTETLFHLTQSLQTSLDISRILEMFFEQLQSIVPVRGMVYKNPIAFTQTFSLGKESAHHVDYRLNLQQESLGELTFSRSRRFAEPELETIEGLISALIFPLRNAVHYRQALLSALRDPLTGAGNRAGMDQSLEREILLAQRYEQPLSILAIDIDFFKNINDKFGHVCGDDVLKEVAQSIAEVTRQTDMTFRFGGEEFMVILSKTDLQGASLIAERVRKFIESLQVESHKELIKTTVSIGVSTLHQGDDNTSLFDRADKALYRAKRSGRNRVVTETLPKA
ncbi:MAG: GGDEF domain-containing protein [Candidatus Pelagadaptatus aseana]|uniref:GGDEF domain-containing protein n=1 Tax=Candidatus Pelagadaptatus aseana TaxID=3120508 RepID=UPI0039B29A5D